MTLDRICRAWPAQAPQPSKVVYNLNPFDQGAHRDLKKPKAIDGPAACTGAEVSR